jgi:hypothetical protein
MICCLHGSSDVRSYERPSREKTIARRLRAPRHTILDQYGPLRCGIRGQLSLPYMEDIDVCQWTDDQEWHVILIREGPFVQLLSEHARSIVCLYPTSMACYRVVPIDDAKAWRELILSFVARRPP